MGTYKSEQWAANMNAISDLMPKSGLEVFLLANERHHGIAFKVQPLVIYVLLETRYYAYKPRAGKSVHDHAKVYFQGPKSNVMTRLSNWVDVDYQIQPDADYMPIGYKYKTSPRYTKRHVTIIPFPGLRGFGGAIERKSGGTQEVRMTFSVPATLQMRFGKRPLSFKTAYFIIYTTEKNKISDSYSRGSAIGFTTDLINSKDKPTHWGTVINGQSQVVQPKGPVH